jgi:hypothetical protein
MMDDVRMDQTMRGATAARRTNGASASTDADELFRSLERASSAIRAYLRSQVICTPYLTLGVAALGGYVLGAGIPPRIAALLVSMAGRTALNQLVTQTLTTRPPSG